MAPRLAALLLALLVLCLQASVVAAGEAVIRTHPESAGVRSLPVDCSDAEGEGWTSYRIEAPAVGWEARPLAVLVSGIAVDRVRISQGDRVYCGQYGDGARADSRFRTGVGGVFVPAQGSSNPVRVAVSGAALQFWPVVIDVGSPASVQRLDALRFAFRIAMLAITFSVVISTALAWVALREVSLLSLSINTALVVVWMAMITGLSGFPEAWLPVGEARLRILLSSPLLVAGITVFLMMRSGRLRRGEKGVLLITAGCCLLALLAVAAWGVPWSYIPAFTQWAEVGVFLLFTGVVLVCLPGALRRRLLPVANLLGVLPLAVVSTLGVFAAGGFGEWKVEAYVGGAAWIAVASSSMLMMRLASLRRQRDEMRALAQSDPLTGLGNRRTALARLQDEVDRRRALGTEFGLVYVDIDHFKQINDGFGHASGDRVLGGVAQLLRQLVRASDVVARLGGDEFVLILVGADEATSLRLAERVRERIELLPLVGSGPEAPLSCTASIGVVSSARYPEAGAEELLRRADEAMYAAKKGGRNRVVRG
ncbi:GGDEF domain-containing protein [uncultured Aquimonas sp.]|uniref:GGDEF domain-containing protein n=1 Tax=uncultured Aquimonas sp. TaxID=385483 RepID=UPI0026097B7C|nr:GGDEF domain-containing protein [uncultured Aquimonas sp.]